MTATEPTIEHLLADTAPEVRAISERLRALILDVLPGAVEWVDLGNRVAAYGTARRMRDLIFAIAPHGAHVNLQFADGVELPDPEGLFEGTGKRIRHVKNRSTNDVERPALRALVEAAVARRRG